MENTKVTDMQSKNKSVKAYISQILELETNKIIIKKANEALLAKKKIKAAEYEKQMESKQQRIQDRMGDIEKYREGLKGDMASYRYHCQEKEHPKGIILRNLFPAFNLLCAGGAGFAFGYWILNWIVNSVLSYIEVDFLVSKPIMGGIGLAIGLGIGLWYMYSVSFDEFDFRSAKTYKADLENKINDKIFRIKKRKEWIQNAEADIEHLNQSLINNSGKNGTLLSFFDHQIEINNREYDQIDHILNQYYNLDILPRDYRSLDCIATLDHIFQNNLADTVRDAILLYREWLAQGMIIRGLENIYNKLDEIGTTMHYMKETLDSIDIGVSAICSDMDSMLKAYEKMEKSQEKILEEARQNRQANEAIQRSNEKFDWYMSQHRQGLL